MAEGYKTLDGEGNFILTDRRSRFIAHAARVTDADEALAFVASEKGKYPDASHCCWAFSIKQGGLCRFTDAGEPSGTAGSPILEVLTRSGIYDAVITVTRYFGGTLLGTGGLVHAYSGAAAGAVKDAGTAMMVPCADYMLSYDYKYIDGISRILNERGAVVTSVDYGGQVTLSFRIRENDAKSVLASITDLTGGKCEDLLLETGLYPMPVEE